MRRSLGDRALLVPVLVLAAVLLVVGVVLVFWGLGRDGETVVSQPVDEPAVIESPLEPLAPESPDSVAPTGSPSLGPAAAASRRADPRASLPQPTDRTVYATVETVPVPNSGDAADDPAIWRNPADPAASTVIGTDKKGGIAVYDLSGKQLQYLPDGNMNNVDLRNGFPLGGKKVTLVTAGNRSDNSIAMYVVDPRTRKLVDVAARRVVTGDDVYGSCMYRSAKTGTYYYFVNRKDGVTTQWELFAAGGKVDARLVRTFDVGGQAEGCVADDQLGHFYAAEEDVGVWKYGAEPGAGSARTSVARVGSNLEADVEGVAIAYGRGGTGYLFVSSQGDNSYSVYRREGTNAFVKNVRIGSREGIDGTEDTDGLDVTSASLGGGFPYGLLVVQDGANAGGMQNFKMVPLERIVVVR